MIGVNEVYRTVLLILNKEQRGYLTPEEFNKIGSQVQREIFERYFDDLNQELRQPQTDYDYADKVVNTDEKLEVFKKNASLTHTSGGVFNLPADHYRLGSVSFTDTNSLPIEAERVNRTDFFLIQRSGLSEASKKYPIYLYEESKVRMYPTSITTGVEAQYVKKPVDINWPYTVNSVGAFIYDGASVNLQNFELHNSEKVEVILRILLYAGVVIRDPQIVQAASGQLQADIANEKR